MSEQESDRITELAEDNARLRALIKDAEWADGTHDASSCPWCVASRDDGPIHRPTCPAFTTDGAVR